MPLGIYVHIPFCRQKCLYCDFNSYAKKERWMDPYCCALKKEIKGFAADQTVDTVYFGGGTPTCIGAERLTELLHTVREHFSLTKQCEITAECNPGTIDFEGLKTLYDAGFNRLSLGLQSTDDAMLKRLGRIHCYTDFTQCYRQAREAGFQNISIDLMYGLPNQSMDLWKKTLEEAVLHNPEHLSCYALKVEEGTPFDSLPLQLPDDDTVRMMYDICVDFLNSAGYKRYEISNFAKPERESRHNLKYWQCDDFIGFGAGACSCIAARRFHNVSSIETYCEIIENKGSAAEGTAETLSLSDQMSEFCFLGLRTSKGICADEFYQRFHRRIEDVYGDVLSKNLKRGTMVYQNHRYRIPDSWIYVSNTILSDFV